MMLKVLVVLTAVCVGSIEARFGQISGSIFTAGKYDVFQIENKPYEFECIFTGTKTDIERSKISWLRPSLFGYEIPVQEGDPVVNVTETREDDKLVSTLHVPGPPEFNVLRHYQCEVQPKPPDEINQHSFAIIGLREKAVPKIQLRNKLEQARFKESVVLNCSVSYENSIANDYYKLIMSWKKDGKLLAVENYEYKTGKITQPFQYTFVVRSHTDGGDYVCSWELKYDGNNSISRNSRVTLKILPFLAGPTMKEVSDEAGSDVKLKCDVVGYPIRFEWRDEEDNLIIGSDSRFRPEEEVLHIDNIDYTDRQEYKCLGIGENETIVEQTIFLRVKGCQSV